MIYLTKGRKEDNWFESSIRRSIENGRKMDFWEDVWWETNASMRPFPIIYSISDQQHLTLGETGVCSKSGWAWGFSFRRKCME